MTVYDLFNKIHNDVNLSKHFKMLYLAQECQDYDFPCEMDEQVKVLLSVERYLDDAFEEILNHKYEENKNYMVIVTKAYDDLENPFSEKTYYDSSLVHVEDLLAKKDSGIDLSEYDGPNFVATYAYEFSDWSEIQSKTDVMKSSKRHPKPL